MDGSRQAVAFWKSARPARYVPVAIIVFVGLALSLALFFFARSLESREIRERFLRAAEDRAMSIANEVRADLLVLQSMRSLYAASQKVEPGEFQTFVEPILAHRPGSETLQWIPGVAGGEAAGYEAGANFDAGRHAALRKAIDDARDSGKPLATGRVKLMDEPGATARLPGSAKNHGEQFGFCVVLPVYKKAAPLDSIEDRRKSYQGCILEVFRIGNLVKESLARLSPRGIDVWVCDESSPVGERLLYLHSARTRTEPFASPGDCDAWKAAEAKGLHYLTKFDVAGRRWSVICAPAPGCAMARRTWHPRGVLAAGLIFTAFVAAFTVLGIRRTALVERLVDKRTRQLHQSEERFRKIATSAQDAIIMMDHRGKISFWNAAATKIFGHAREAALGKNAHELLAAPQYLPQCREAFPAFQRTGTGPAVEKTLELHGVKSSGEEFPVELSLSATKIDGKWQAIGIIRDITERKQAEKELRIKDSAIASSINAIAIADLQGKLTYVNDAFLKFWGYDNQQEVLGKSAERFWLNEQRALKVLEGLRDCSGWSGELIAQRKDGSVFDAHLSASMVTNEAGDPICAMASFLDITEHKQAVETLRQSEEKLAGILDSLADHISMIDEEHNVVWANHIAEELFGADMVGKKCYRAYHRRDKPCSPCPVERTFADGKTHEHETGVIRADGGGMNFWCTASVAARHEDGRPKLVVEVSRDITERKRAEQQLAGAKLAAEAANRAKSEFLANMSHEIRTPMTSILGFTELLMMPNVSPPDQQDYCRTVRRNAKALLSLINDILDLSKIEAEKMTVEPAACSVQQILEDVLSSMRVKAAEKGLKLEVYYDYPFPKTIHTDPIRLRQVLMNLVGNAVKFTEKGSVRIAVRCLRPRDASPRMEFAVFDTGIGISRQQIAALFEPFTQADGSATRRFGGTGLGLTISKRLAEILGGDIEVESRPGTGSTFTLRIDPGPLDGVPMLDAPADLAETEATEPVRQWALRGRVLLAEDAEDTQRLIRFVLERAGLEVETVENGREACEKAAARAEEGQPFDLILMDIQMPEMDGYEATERLRRAGWAGPIVALTAHAMAGDRQKCLRAGCSDYVGKPINHDKLLSTVSQHLGRVRAAAEPIRS